MPLPSQPQTPKPPRKPLFGNALFAATAISFSLTFVGALAALMLGLVPGRLLDLRGDIDAGVVLLIVPLAALLFAIIVEVVRSMLHGGFKTETARPQNPLSAWRPGHGEG